MIALFVKKLTWEERAKTIAIARQRIDDRQRKQREAEAKRRAAAARKRAK